MVHVATAIARQLHVPAGPRLRGLASLAQVVCFRLWEGATRRSHILEQNARPASLSDPGGDCAVEADVDEIACGARGGVTVRSLQEIAAAVAARHQRDDVRERLPPAGEYAQDEREVPSADCEEAPARPRRIRGAEDDWLVEEMHVHQTHQP